MARPLVDLWPMAGVRVVLGDLELRFLDDELLVELADLAAEGVHDPDAMPFLVPWTRGTPDEVRRSVLQYQWRLRAEAGQAKCGLELAVLRDGELLGVQGLYTERFAVTRAAETGSWLGRRFQGQGVGTQMRLAILHLIFDGLRAERATTSAFVDNAASTGVTRNLGYRDNGEDVAVRDDASVVSRRYVLDRASWRARPDEQRPPVTLEGVDALRGFLGA